MSLPFDPAFWAVWFDLKGTVYKFTIMWCREINLDQRPRVNSRSGTFNITNWYCSRLEKPVRDHELV